MIKLIARIWRSMPLRLAVLLVLLFAAVSLLGLAASYAITRATFEQSIRDDLQQDLAGFRAAPNAQMLAGLVQAESFDTDPQRLVLSFVTRDGQLFGNGAIARDDEGYHFVSLQGDGGRVSGNYIALSTRLYGGQLTIARSRAEVEALAGVFLNILWISLLPTMLVALSGGLVLARRSKRHVEVVRETLSDFTSGDLAARVTIGPRWSDDLRDIGKAVNQMATAQERTVGALRQVSSDIAHDLRTPIQRVSLRLDELASNVVDKNAAKLVEETRAEVAGMAEVFQALLQLGQVEQSSLRKTFSDVDLTKLCDAVVEVAKDEHQGQTLSARLPDAPCFVQGDRTLLGQMLANLLQNARRHAGEGADICVSLQQNQGQTTLVVADNGPGIPEAERDKVLQRLYRLDRSRGTPGNGLGLSLVDGIARLHRADLTLEDNAPGLRVTVTFLSADS